MEATNKKIILLLMLSQAFYLSAMSIDLTITALVGTLLASNRIFATLPVALISILSVVVAPQIPKLAAKIGLKRLLVSGGLIAALGGLSSWYSLNIHSFWFLCLGTSCVGIYQAIANYYRYVAADISHGQEVKSISLVMTAGVVVAIIGPALATWSSQAFVPIYSGSYLVVLVLGLFASITNSFLPKATVNGTISDAQTNQQINKDGLKIRFSTLFKRPSFKNGALFCLTSCFAMALIMSGAPILMQSVLHNTPEQRMIGMQLHMIGMYVPVLLLLFLSKYLSLRVQIIGASLLGIIATLISFFNVTSGTVMLSMLLIGIFWSLSYASGSALLTESYSAEERESARGKGEIFPVLGMAIGSTLAGPFSSWFTWNYQMLIVLLFITLSIISVMKDWKRI